MVKHSFKVFDITRIYARTFDTYYKNGNVHDEMVYAIRK